MEKKTPKKAVAKKATASKKAAPRKRAPKGPRKHVAGPNEKVLEKTANYSIILNEKTKEADLHFDLQNPVDDRYFAYALTLMDLFQTLEGVKEVAPPSVVEDFVTALKVLKGMSESIKHKIEEEAGFKEPLMDEARKEKIKKMLGTIKGNLEKEFPDAKVIRIKTDEAGLEDAIKGIIKQMKEESGMGSGPSKPSKRKSKKEKDNLEKDEIIPRRNTSSDLEF
jgi:hypothetical protein